MRTGNGLGLFSCLLLLSLCCAHEQQQQQQHPSAMLVGTVFCDTCFHQEFSKSSHFISGASVAVECSNGEAKATFRKEARTNRHGVFRVRLPAEVGRHVSTVKACSVKLVRSSEPFCAVASSATSAGGLRLRSRRNGVHVFSAGFFTFKPLKQPELCYQEPRPESVPVEDQKIGPGFFFPPPIPFVPSPPNIGGVPLPPNPLTPPPSLLPPNPLQPPPSLLPPLPFQPPPPPFLSIPPLPFLTPPSPPPPSLFPPSFSFPPLFPGIPPSSSSSSKRTSP